EGGGRYRWLARDHHRPRRAADRGRRTLHDGTRPFEPVCRGSLDLRGRRRVDADRGAILARFAGDVVRTARRRPFLGRPLPGARRALGAAHQPAAERLGRHVGAGRDRRAGAGLVSEPETMIGWRSAMLRSLLGYTAVFALLTHAWWSTATYAVAPGTDPRDARLIIWILGWVAHALAHAPASLFDAPIFHPAPGQLAGSEHFLSAQLVFGPIYWAGGNPVLAANVVALLSYPLAAIAMDRLLSAQG